MTGLYFSGTGNTRHCVERFVRRIDEKNRAFSIETPNLDRLLEGGDVIVFGYPTHFSNAPKIVRDFIVDNAAVFRGKRVFLIATMGLFSGDGTGCGARILRRCGANVVGGLHLVMPDCIADEKLLKKSPEKNLNLVEMAGRKTDAAAERFRAGKPTREGLNIFYHMAGLFGQRLWFYGKTLTYKDEPKIAADRCTVCGLCVKSCPMHNLEKRDTKIVHGNRCTMCYRCVNGCPTQAITILGKRVHSQ